MGVSLWIMMIFLLSFLLTVKLFSVELLSDAITPFLERKDLMSLSVTERRNRNFYPRAEASKSLLERCKQQEENRRYLQEHLDWCYSELYAMTDESTKLAEDLRDSIIRAQIVRMQNER